MKKIIGFLIVILTILGFSTINKTKAATKYSMAAMVNTGGVSLNVRANASTSSAVLTKLQDNSYITLISNTGSWYYAEYQDNKYGYVHKDYLKLLSGDARQVDTNGSSLNVRTGPSTSYYKVASINDDEYVIVLKTVGTWVNVLYNGNQVGYVSSSYLANPYTYPKVSLNITSYKQFDSRWAYESIGSSGKTFKQIGCLTTVMSMTESYRQNKVITPLAMRNNLKYTASGSMYWPSNYSFYYSSTNYLKNIYNLLKSGKPVILGCTNSNGGEHWVVIYGYKGANTLTASNFLINDPGSSYRTNLSEFLAAYPTYKRIAYYN